MKKSKLPNWRARVTLHTMFAEVDVVSGGGILTKRVALESVAGVFNDVPMGTGLLPQNVLFMEHAPGGMRIGMYIPAQAHKLLTLQQTYRLPMPAFVLVGQKTAYSLFAVKGEKWPNRWTDMYYPPLPNIFQDGSICAGEMTFPECTPGNIGEVWEMVVGSYFTGHLTGGRSQSHAGVFDLWHEMYLAETAVFPEGELVPTKKTLGQVMRGEK